MSEPREIRSADEPTVEAVEWLRATLRRRLDDLRAEHPGPRAELDALLAPPASAVAPAPPIPGTVSAMAERLDLRPDEQAVVAVLFAAAVDPALGRALGLLADPLGRGVPTWEAVVALLGLPRTHRLIPEDGLRRWGLVVSSAAGLALDPAIEARLAGRPGRDGILVEPLAVIPPCDPLPGWPVDALAERIRRAMGSGARGVRLWLRGPEGSGRRTLFASVARSLGLVGVSVRGAAADVVRAAVRLSWLDGLAPCWLERVRLPADVPIPPLQGWLDGEPGPADAGVLDLAVRLPAPDRAGRAAAWEALVPAFRSWPEPARAALVDAWASRPGQLVAVARSGAATAEEAAELLRADARQRLEGHCDALETPFEWDDLVLPPALSASLRELAHEAIALPAIWSVEAVGRLFPHGRSVAALFSGPPGTGKTLAAQVIARAIGLPLFRVDLSRMVSKYVGETSQNLARLLGAARDTDAVVLFDEADALFGRRTEVHDAHDRYANTETDYLLQALDAWPGIAILATNKRGNIDPAFLRRMRMVLEFPRPDATERRRIWHRLGATLLPGVAGLDRIADTVELTGAQIKGALLTARVLATRDGEATPDHALRGVERELEKEGRGLSARDRKRLLDG